MSFTNLGDSIAAGNAVDATIYTCPAGKYAIIGSLVVYNTTGGPLNITISVTRQTGVTFILDGPTALGATTGLAYTTTLCPLTLKPGEILLAKGSGAGINVTYSGIQLS